MNRFHPTKYSFYKTIDLHLFWISIQRFSLSNGHCQKLINEYVVVTFNWKMLCHDVACRKGCTVFKYRRWTKWKLNSLNCGCARMKVGGPKWNETKQSGMVFCTAYYNIYMQVNRNHNGCITHNSERITSRASMFYRLFTHMHRLREIGNERARKCNVK